MKTNLKFIGIDVSMNTLDICILSHTTESFVIKNESLSIQKFFGKIFKEAKEYEFHVCSENTGKYGWVLNGILSELNCSFYVVNPLHLKRSIGMVRGKNDKIDAIRIAYFIKKNYLETPIFKTKREALTDIQVLLCERAFRVEKKKQLNTKSKDVQIIKNKKLANYIQRENNKLINELKRQIKTIEKEIKKIIKHDKKLIDLDKRLKSIPGVGDILSWNILVKTNEFKSITEPRKLACYCGVAPFANISGISIFGKNRVSNLADKSLKKLLHLGALSAIRLENDLAIYYKRKVKEGKNKMSVLNAVRNKIIHLIYALVKNQTFYENRLVLS